MIKPSFSRLRSIGIFCRVTRLPCCDICMHGIFSSIANEYVGFTALSKRETDEPFHCMWLQHALNPGSKQAVYNVLSGAGFVVDWPRQSDELTIRLTLPKDPRVQWGVVRRHVLARSVFWYWHALPAHLHRLNGPYGAKAVSEYADWLPFAPLPAC